MYQLVNGVIVAGAGRWLRISHVVEHPKSGGSWLRNMLQSYLGGPAYFYDRLVREKTVIQLHRLYRKIYCNPVVLFRDPRDMFTSFYYHELRKAEPMVSPHFIHDPRRQLKEDFAKYLRSKLLYPIHPRFRFCEFVDSWYERPGAFAVRYEDLLADCDVQLASILEFLGEKVDSKKLRDVIAYHSFANETKRRYGVARQPGEGDSKSFQRKAISGDWKNIFNPDSCRLIQQYEWRSIEKLNYEHDKSWIERFLSGN